MTMTQKREDVGKGWTHIKKKQSLPTWIMTPTNAKVSDTEEFAQITIRGHITLMVEKIMNKMGMKI